MSEPIKTPLITSTPPSGGRLSSDTDERKFLDTLDNQDGKDDVQDTDDDEAEKGDKKRTSESSEKEDGTEEDEEIIDDAGDEEDGEKEGEEDEEADKKDEDEDDGLELDGSSEDDSLYKQLKAKDKDIFKKVPGLKSVLFREQEFTKRFHSIEDADEAKSLAETFTQFQDDIQSGDATTFVEATKSLGEEVLTKFSGNFLPALQKADKDIYLSVLAPEFKKMFRAALTSGNEDIANSARNLNHFLFGNTNVEKDEGFVAGKKDPKEDKIAKREKELEERQAKSFGADVQNVAINRARKIISKSLEGFNLSPLTVKHLTDEIYKRTVDAMNKDIRYTGNMDALWKRAGKEGYTTEGKDRLITTFLSRAKVGIPKYRSQVLTEAKVSAKSGSEGDKKTPKRIPSSGGVGKSSLPSAKTNAKDVDWSQTSDRDILEGKAVLRKK